VGARVQNERACLDAVALQELDTLVTADLDRIPAKPTAEWAWSISAAAVAAAARRRQAISDAADLRQEAALRATERGRQTRGQLAERSKSLLCALAGVLDRPGLVQARRAHAERGRDAPRRQR
jgi:hypothetical protein